MPVQTSLPAAPSGLIKEPDTGTSAHPPAEGRKHRRQEGYQVSIFS